jgi:hypothetical protein
MPEDFKRYDHMVLCLARAANAASGEEHQILLAVTNLIVRQFGTHLSLNFSDR